LEYLLSLISAYLAINKIKMEKILCLDKFWHNVHVGLFSRFSWKELRDTIREGAKHLTEKEVTLLTDTVSNLRAQKVPKAHQFAVNQKFL
jgi:hypothetical protein